MDLKLNPTRARWLVALALLITLVGAWLNLHVQSAGIVQDALLDSDNRYERWQREAATHPELTQGDTLSFVLDFPQGIDTQGLGQIIRMSQELRTQFPEGVVWSLASNSADYRVDAQDGKPTLESRPHLSQALLDSQGQVPAGFDLAGWKRQVQQDSSVYPVLVGPGFDHAQIIVFLPPDYSEQGILERCARYLEQRDTPTWQWMLFKGDIRPAPAYANVSLGGWAVARGLMHYALISDVLFYSTLGLLIATLAAVFSLGSWRQAVQVSAVILMSFVLVRAAIPVMDWMGLRFQGLPVHERVYFLLVLSALIVSGISFNVRAFEAYNDAWRERPDTPPAELWRQVGTGLRSKFNVVALIAFLNFATLPQIGIRGIMEVGVLSALGIALQRLLAGNVLPALHLCVGGVPDELGRHHCGHSGQGGRLGRPGRLGTLHGRYLLAIDWLPQAAWRRIAALRPRQSLLVSLGLSGLALGCALGIVLHDVSHPASPWIKVQERPIDYLPHTIIDRARAMLNRPGGAGFGRLSYLVLPRHVQPGQAPVEDPVFLARAFEFQQRVAALPGAMPVRSVLDKLGQLAERSPDVHAALPANRAQAHELLQMIRWDLDDDKLAGYFWSEQGLVLYAAHAADNSRDLRDFADATMALAEKDFADLQVLPFGRLHTYHQTDQYISQGKPLNVLTSFPLVLGVCLIWLGWRQAGQRKSLPPGARTLAPLRSALAISLPFVFAYSVVVVLMALCQIPLDQASACATALGINAAIDFDIYVVDDFAHRLGLGETPDEALHYALHERGRVTLIDAQLNAVCFSFLLLSPFLPIQRLGLMMIVLLIACAFGALFLMTGVLRSCVEARSTPSDTDARTAVATSSLTSSRTSSQERPT